MVDSRDPGFPLQVRCTRCQCLYEGREVRHAFTRERLLKRNAQHVKRYPDAPVVLKRICNGCLLRDRFTKTRTHPFLEKAQNTRRDHAKKLGFSMTQMIDIYEWSDGRMTKTFEEAWERVCVYCEDPFREMRGGIQEMTVDIEDRRLLPFWRSNVAICCRNCNSMKGTMVPEEWQIRLHVLRKHRRHLALHPLPTQLSFLEPQANAA